MSFVYGQVAIESYIMQLIDLVEPFQLTYL